MTSQRQSRQKRTVLALVAMGFAFFGIGFAMVPLYNLICDITGVNTISGSGRVTVEEALAGRVDYDREVIVEFDVTMNEAMPWTVEPLVKRMKVHPGKAYEVQFRARNNAGHTIVGQAVPGITPWQATEHFNKTECFCFQQQTLRSGESADMGLRFVLSPDLPEKYSTVTLSYTFMDTAGGVASPPAAPHENLSMNQRSSAY